MLENGIKKSKYNHEKLAQKKSCASFLLGKNTFSILILIALFILTPAVTMAQTSSTVSETVTQREARLRAELEKVEAEQRENETSLRQAQSQTASIARDISILNAKIKQAQLNIKAKNLQIESLTRDISTKDKHIKSLIDDINTSKDSLAQLIRKTREADDTSLPEIILSGKTLAGALLEVDEYHSVQVALKETFAELRDTKAQTEDEKTALSKRRNQELDAKAEIEKEQRSIQALEKDKQLYLTFSKNAEKGYQNLISMKQAKAAEIRAALFALRDAAAIPFDKALMYATEASKNTGVRPAFLLAILTQESNLGQNVGSCYLTDTTTGEGRSARTGNVIKNVMKPGRDVAPFISITKSLGMDYTKTLVSCPFTIGYGGAMGPAQFIPSTWVLFKERIAKIVGKSVPNPWEARDAFAASSIYLSDLGATANSYTAERNAACRYYSGRNCDTKSGNAFYGNQVMVKAQNIQENMINPLQGF